MFKLFSTFVSLATLALAVPTLYLAGDSTMANQPASSGIQGWGVEAPQFFTGINIVNDAVSGRSARSYTREGRFATIVSQVKAGDFVIIEFGHNDGGSPDTSDRASVVGEGNATQTVTLSDGTTEVVHTFPWYLEQAIDQIKAKGATPIISSQTPDNPFENSDTEINSPPRFVGYAKDAAAARGVPYVDHFAAMIQLYGKLGKATTESYFPQDHTHTNTAGATQVAFGFMSGLKCPAANGVLNAFINSAGQGAGARC